MLWGCFLLVPVWGVLIYGLARKRWKEDETHQKRSAETATRMTASKERFENKTASREEKTAAIEAARAEY